MFANSGIAAKSVFSAITAFRPSEPVKVAYNAVFVGMTSTFARYDYNRVMLFWFLNLLPALLTLAAWIRRHRNPSAISNQRRILFGAGLLIGVLGSLILVSFVILNIADPSRVGNVNVWDGRLSIAGFYGCSGWSRARSDRQRARASPFLTKWHCACRPDVCEWFSDEHIAIPAKSVFSAIVVVLAENAVFRASALSRITACCQI